MARTPDNAATSRAISELEAEIVEVVRHVDKLQAQFLILVADYDALGGWVASGALSCAHWLAGVADIEVSTAREHVRVARALRTLPNTTARLVDGSLSYAKARQLTRIATTETEDELLAVADTVAAGRLPGALASWLQRRDPAAAERHRRAEKRLTVRTNPTGTRTLTVTLPAEEMAEIEAAVERELRQMDRDRHDGEEDTRNTASTGGAASPAPQPVTARRSADALLRLVRRSDAPADASPPRRPRVELVLHRRQAEAELLDGTPLPGAVARRLSCDADVRVLTHGPDGSPLDLGRRSRLVSPRMRRLVEERDGYACTYPGCTATRFLEVHHVVHWEDGGTTDLHNLVLLCDGHHRWVHVNGWPRTQLPIQDAAA